MVIGLRAFVSELSIMVSPLRMGLTEYFPPLRIITRLTNASTISPDANIEGEALDDLLLL
jgi:hypothetical protein